MGGAKKRGFQEMMHSHGINDDLNSVFTSNNPGEKASDSDDNGNTNNGG